MAHTPGPWIAGWSGDPETQTKDEAGPLNIVAVGHGGIAVCAPILTGHASTWEIVEANAHLIAAAPDLLAALKRLASYGDVFAYGNGETNPHTEALAAIAKAEGR